MARNSAFPSAASNSRHAPMTAVTIDNEKRIRLIRSSLSAPSRRYQPSRSSRKSGISYPGAVPEPAQFLCWTAACQNAIEARAKAPKDHSPRSVAKARPARNAEPMNRLLNQLGEADAAADAFRQGLGMVTNSPMPAIPHLTPDSE